MSAPTSPETGALTVHLSTPPGVGGVAIVELFGDRADSALGDAFRPRSGAGLPSADATRFGVLLDAGGEPIDDVIVAYTSSAQSWCGIAGWSICCHGGPAVTDRVLRALTDRGGTRCSTSEVLAGSGSTGALDRISCQAYDAFLQARSERAAHYFFRQYQGAFTARLLSLRHFVGQTDWGRRVLGELDEMIRDARQAIRFGEPIRLLIAGVPNAGKSTLFNALLGHERVAVSSTAGTTRDLITETIEVGGYPVTLIDSAGLRPEEAAEDAVERAGIERALTTPRDAALLVRDVDGPLSGSEREFLDSLPKGSVLKVRTKCDLARSTEEALSPDSCVVSGRSGAGLDILRDAIRAAWLGPPEGEEIPPLPFTMTLVERIKRLRDVWSRALTGASPCGAEPTLDGLRSCLIECFPGLPDVRSDVGSPRLDEEKGRNAAASS